MQATKVAMEGIAQMRKQIAAEAERGDDVGVSARMTLRLVEAASLAIAFERDAGTKENVILEQSHHAIANIIACYIGTLVADMEMYGPIWRVLTEDVKNTSAQMLQQGKELNLAIMLELPDEPPGGHA